MTCENMNDLISYYFNFLKNKNDFSNVIGKCEHCSKTFNISSILAKRKIKKDKLLLCCSCAIKWAKKNQSEEKKKKITEKRKQTNIEKYGCENTWQLEKVKEMSRNRDWTERNEHSKQTCIERYGVDNGAKTEKSKEHTKNTLKKKYGSVENAYKERQKKIEQTNIEKRGHKSNFLDNGFKEKAWTKMIEKYGRIIYSRIYFYNDMCFDSSWELAYYIFLTDTNANFTFQPKVDWTYIGSDNKEHHYFPDFLVGNEYQEIKGRQFFNEKGEPFDSYTKHYWWEKYNFIKEKHVRIITWDDMKPIMNYIENKYGKGYLKSFIVKK